MFLVPGSWEAGRGEARGAPCGGVGGLEGLCVKGREKGCEGIGGVEKDVDRGMGGHWGIEEDCGRAVIGVGRERGVVRGLEEVQVGL